MAALHALYRRLCLAPTPELDRAFAGGRAPAPDNLCGWEFYGYNTTPLADLLGIRKFKKAFYRRASGRTEVAGYNAKVRPSRLDAPWTNGGPGAAYQGFYDVKPGREGAAVAAHPDSLFLDYGANPANGLLDGSFLRDFVVQPDPAVPEVLLGRAYAKLGPAVFPVSYFVLQRAHQLTLAASALES